MSGEEFGDYRLEAFIGRGGMAEVFRAKVKSNGQVVALKRLLPEFSSNKSYVEAFVAEAELTQQLKHERIVEILDAGAVEQQYYIAMEYVDGRDLSRILGRCLERGILLPIDFACYVAHQVAVALDFAHNAKNSAGKPLGIVHCDVTPSNIFISALGETVLGDFGIAQSGDSDTLIQQGIVGKLHYVAPERIEGEPATPSTDLFALGAILYEMLTNAKAYAGTEPDEVFQRIVDGSTIEPSRLRQGVSKELDSVVMRAISPRRDPAEERASMLKKVVRALGKESAPIRYRNAAQLAADLTDLYNPAIGTPLAIASVVRGLFGVV